GPHARVRRWPGRFLPGSDVRTVPRSTEGASPMSQTTAAAGGVTAAAPIGVRLDRMPITPLHRRLPAGLGVGLFFDTFENNLSGTIGKVLQSDFGFGATSLKLVLASVFVGQFVGSLTLGRIADRFGRRRAFLINLAIYSVFSLLGAFSPNAG